MTSRRAAVGIPVGVAAAVVIAIVATVLLRSGGGGNPAPLPLSLAGGGGGTGRAEAAMDSKMAGAPAGGGATYRFVGPIPDGLPEDADAYSLKDSPVDRDAVRRLADALGLSGEVKTEPDALVVRDGELVLRVSTTPSRMWSFYREVANSCDKPATTDPTISYRADCSGGGSAGICLEGAESPCNDTPETVVEPAPATATTDEQRAEQQKAEEIKAREAEAAESSSSSGSGSASSGTATAGEPVSDQAALYCPPAPPCPENTKCAAPAIACGEPYQEPKQLPLPDESVARALAKKVFDATGVGESVRMRAERSFDAWYISATVEIDDLEVVGFGHYVSIDTDGKIRDASGSLATAEVLDRYPLVSAKAGLERLQKQQGGFATREMMCLPAPGATGGACAPIAPENLEVTDVRLGLLFSPIWENEKEKVFLVPAWVYDVKGRDFPEAVMAITDEYLQAVTPEQVDPQPVDPGLVDPGQGQSEPGVEPDAPPPSRPEPAPADPAVKPEPAAS